MQQMEFEKPKLSKRRPLSPLKQQDGVGERFYGLIIIHKPANGDPRFLTRFGHWAKCRSGHANTGPDVTRAFVHDPNILLSSREWLPDVHFVANAYYDTTTEETVVCGQRISFAQWLEYVTFWMNAPIAT